MLGFALLLFIIILIIIVICYYTINREDVKVLNVEDIPIFKYRKNNIGSIQTEVISTCNNQSVVFYGEIPQNYIYWSIGVFPASMEDVEKSDDDLLEKCHESISLGNYQTVHPGSSIAIILSNNNCAIKETIKELEKCHYKKYPNRRLFFEQIGIETDFMVNFECYFRKVYFR